MNGIIDHPYSFCLAWFVINIALGYWLGWRCSSWYIARLKNRIEILKLELAGVDRRVR